MKRIGGLAAERRGLHLGRWRRRTCRTTSRTSASNTPRTIPAFRTASGDRSAPRSRASSSRRSSTRWRRRSEEGSVSVPARPARQAPRHRAVLDLAAEKSGWGKPLPAGRFRGIAVHGGVRQLPRAGDGGFGERTAAVKVHQHRLCRGQRLGDQSGHDQGADGRRHRLRPDRCAEGRDHDQERATWSSVTSVTTRCCATTRCPRSKCYIVPSTETPGGIGEPSTALAAGSLVNAVAAATGRRIYSLPIKPEQVRGGTA